MTSSLPCWVCSGTGVSRLKTIALSAVALVGCGQQQPPAAVTYEPPPPPVAPAPDPIESAAAPELAEIFDRFVTDGNYQEAARAGMALRIRFPDSPERARIDDQMPEVAKMATAQRTGFITYTPAQLREMVAAGRQPAEHLPHATKRDVVPFPACKLRVATIAASAGNYPHKVTVDTASRYTVKIWANDAAQVATCEATGMMAVSSFKYRTP